MTGSRPPSSCWITTSTPLLGGRGSAGPPGPQRCRPAAGTVPAAVPVLADREQALAWARAERLRHDGPWDEVITRHATAVQAARQLGDRFGQAEALTSLGAVRRLTGGYQGAARDLQQALDISRKIGNRDAEVMALNESGTLSRVCGDLRHARSWHQEALGLARQIGDPLAEADALAGLARCAQAAGSSAESEGTLREALAIFQRIGAAQAADVSAELDVLSEASQLADLPEPLRQADHHES
jgi:tetratricopeptide (TPR) repeat protein